MRYKYKIFLILLPIILILSIIFGLNKLVFEYMDSIVFITICFVIILTVFLIIIWFAVLDTRTKTRKEILNNITPRKFILEDIIIIKRFGHPTPENNDKIIKIGRNNKLRYRIIPVIRDVETNYLLMSIGQDFYGSYKYYYQTSILTNRVD